MYKLTHAHAGLFIVGATGQVAALARTNLAVAFTVFALGLYAILTRRDADQDRYRRSACSRTACI